MSSYELLPELKKETQIRAGDAAARERDLLYLGNVSESGRKRTVWLDISGEQVVAVVGKRGTGKSFTLGVILEGLASQRAASNLSAKVTPRAAMVFDIMDIFWSSTIPLTADGSDELRRQYARMVDWGGLTGEPLSVDVWIPAGFERPDIDPDGAKSLRIAAHDLELDDWAALFEIDIYSEPRGMLLHELIDLVQRKGYIGEDGEAVMPRLAFSLDDLIRCCAAPEVRAAFHENTVRSVRQRLTTFATLPLFQGESTSLRSLLRSDRACILMLSRLSDALKNVVVAVLTKRVMRERRDASFAQKRLELQPNLGKLETERLRNRLENSIPRTWILMDEAHVLVAADAPRAARDAIIRYAKEGRNYGLSLCVATQQPSALDPRLMSQVETLVTHQLTAPRDAQSAEAMIRSPLPTKILIDGNTESLQSLLRQLPQGTAIFSSGNAPNLPRCCIIRVRARITAHGGYEA